MTETATTGPTPEAAPRPAPETAPHPAPEPAPPPRASFVLYLEGEEHEDALDALVVWTHQLLLPVYARETTSQAPWCPRWWQHQEAVAQLYGLWMAWQQLTGPGSDLVGPAMWHRDYLAPVLATLRDPGGPFAGCKPGGHRAKQPPYVEPAP